MSGDALAVLGAFQWLHDQLPAARTTELAARLALPDLVRIASRWRAALRADIAALTRLDIAAPTRPGIAAPTRSDIATPTRPDIAAPTRPNIATPTRPDLATPTQPDIAAPTRLDIATPTRPEIASGAALRPCAPVRIEAPAGPFAAVGIAYVLLGSRLGAPQLARALAARLPTPEGRRYFEHGPEDRHLWQAFCRSLDARETTRRAYPDIHAGAHFAFCGFKQALGGACEHA